VSTADDPGRARVRYEVPEPGIARITLARPERRNAQDKRLLHELNEAFDRACQDDAVRVIVLAADGPDFSSGHDLGDETTDVAGHRSFSGWSGFDLPGAEGYLAQEEEYYLGLCRRWRDLPKPTIAQVQGRVIGAGLMLIWPCDLIVAATDASFADPVVSLGLNGHEYFTHVWELGARRAKEILFTGASISAVEAQAIGMVNRVVEPAELNQATLELAQAVAARPTMGVKLAKLAVNQSLDAQGQVTALRGAFALHQLGHSHNMQRFGWVGDPSGLAAIRRTHDSREDR
jgi:enoyl-CoA hydratase/carnithine racemase